jgi:site-specific recombinase XerD
MENDLKKLNKQIERNKDITTEQNKKLYDIDTKLNETENHMKTSEKYLSGFKNFFGFLPNLFSKAKKQEKNIKEDQKKESPEKVKVPLDEIDDAHVLNQNAKELHERIKQSLLATNELENKIDKNNKNLEKLKNDSQNILK